MNLILLIAACCLMGAAAIDYSDRRPFAWTELLGASYASGFLAGVV